MNKLLIFLLLIPMVSFSETWVCAFKCYIDNEVCQEQFKRKGAEFLDEHDLPYSFFKESEYFLTLVRTGAKKGAYIHGYIINKETGEFKKQGFSDNGFVEPRRGKCEIVN